MGPWMCSASCHIQLLPQRMTLLNVSSARLRQWKAPRAAGPPSTRRWKPKEPRIGEGGTPPLGAGTCFPWIPALGLAGRSRDNCGRDGVQGRSWWRGRGPRKPQEQSQPRDITRPSPEVGWEGVGCVGALRAPPSLPPGKPGLGQGQGQLARAGWLRGSGCRAPGRGLEWEREAASGWRGAGPWLESDVGAPDAQGHLSSPQPWSLGQRAVSAVAVWERVPSHHPLPSV
jgi:hypothetical protein